MKNDRKANRLLGWICIVLGLFPIAIAVGLVKADPSSIHAPMWVIGASGLVFVAAGALVLGGSGKRLTHVLAGFIVLSFSLISGWVAFYGPADGFSGGIPFLPKAVNVKIARWVFAGGSVMCLLLFFFAVRQLMNPKPESEQTTE